MHPFSNGTVYVNFAGFEDEQDVTPTETFGPNLVRLERIRSEYDPDRLFAAAARRP
jgi:berberine-like enzyme